MKYANKYFDFLPRSKAIYLYLEIWLWTLFYSCNIEQTTPFNDFSTAKLGNWKWKTPQLICSSYWEKHTPVLWQWVAHILELPDLFYFTFYFHDIVLTSLWFYHYYHHYFYYCLFRLIIIIFIVISIFITINYGINWWASLKIVW